MSDEELQAAWIAARSIWRDSRRRHSPESLRDYDYLLRIQHAARSSGRQHLLRDETTNPTTP